MNKLSWIFIGATFLILALFSYFFIYPQTTSILKIYSDLNKNKTDLENINTEKDALAKLSKNNQLQTLYDIATKYIPETQQSGELVIELTAIAEQSAMKVEQISLEASKTATTPASADTTGTTQADTTKTNTTTPAPASTTPATEAQPVDFSMKISGSFPGFIKTLQSIETSSRLITISNMQLTQATDVFSASITGKAYYKKGISLTNDIKNMDISQKTIEMFTNLKTYGSPIDLPTESGFGRENPFAPTP